MIAKNKICRSLLVFSLGICLFAASDNTPYSVAVDLHNPKVEKNYIEKRRKYVISKINIPEQIKCADKLFTDAKAVPAAAKPPAVTTVKAAHATIIAAPISQWYQACPSKSMFITGLFPQYAYKLTPFTVSESR